MKTELILANLTHAEYKAFFNAKVQWLGGSGITDADLDRFNGGYAPFISTYSTELCAAIKAMDWTKIKIVKMSEFQVIVRRDDDDDEVLYESESPVTVTECKRLVKFEPLS